MPRLRGFHSFFGFYTGASGHFDHTRGQGYDFRRNTRPFFQVKGAYSTDIFTDKTTDIIKKHNFKRKPLYLYLSYQALHAPLEVPNEVFK